jgi:UDP-2,4-diacetamido-2,4,6-trideoxy-beta-L-altropyranose hydrolase
VNPCSTGKALLLIRADASGEIGGGHVMRCLALAQGWQDRGGQAALLGKVPARLAARLKSECLEHLPLAASPGSRADLEETIRAARRLQASCLVVDHYGWGGDFQQAVADASLPLLFLDDNGHCDHYAANWVLNQNVHAQASYYPKRREGTRLLLGTRYALLRREFRQRRAGARKIAPRARKLLVTLGAGHSGPVALRLLEGLARAEEAFEVVYLVGPASTQRDALEGKASRLGLAIDFRSDVRDMPALLEWADLAVTAGGSTCWEMSYLGLPHIVVVLAENQEASVRRLDAWGSAVSLGRQEEVTADRFTRVLDEIGKDQDRRREMSDLGRQLVDGFGVERVLWNLGMRGQDVEIDVRPVTREDRRLLWQWACDPVVRAHSFHPETISWPTHCEWFEQQLQEEDVWMFVARIRGGLPIGLVRFRIYDRSSQAAEISIQLDEDFRGFKLGLPVLRAGHRAFLARTQARQIHAWILESNPRSIRLFEKAGYVFMGSRTKAESPARVYEYAPMRLLYCGNNRVGRDTLRWLIEQGEKIVAVVAHPESRCTCGQEILDLAQSAGAEIFRADQIRRGDCIARLQELQIDVGLSVYFGYILRKPLIDLPSEGFYNLHPAWLPYNRGAHPNVWSIVESTPAGATLHVLDEGIDTGDIVLRKEVPVEESDTAETLYRKCEDACREVFRNGWPLIRSGNPPRTVQKQQEGTFHRVADLARLDRIDLDRTYTARELIDQIRARTFPPHAGAHFICNGRKVFLRIEMQEEENA